MNWEAIGAVVEILSAAFVLIALMYLATRVKYAKNAAADTNRLKISTNSVAFICRTMAALPLIHGVRQMFNGKAAVLCLHSPYPLMKTARSRSYRSNKRAQFTQAAKKFDMCRVVG